MVLPQGPATLWLLKPEDSTGIPLPSISCTETLLPDLERLLHSLLGARCLFPFSDLFPRGLLPQRQPLCLFPYSAATVVSLKPNWSGPMPIPDALSCHPRPLRHRMRAASNSHHVFNNVSSCLSPSTRNTPFYQACPSRFPSLSLPWPPFLYSW